jgi:hypothetical protein
VNGAQQEELFGIGESDLAGKSLLLAVSLELSKPAIVGAKPQQA